MFEKNKRIGFEEINLSFKQFTLVTYKTKNVFDGKKSVN